jgi:hypothetical protein
MSVTPSPIGGFAAQFFDNNGVILSGGKIYTYAAGTTTPQATYTSAAGTTPHANPIILDSAGRVPGGEIWLTDGLVYKFVIETATGSLLGTYDNITGVNSNFVNYTIQEEVQTATAGQTVFNLSTINYTPGTNSLTVYIDGVNQYVGDSYLETDSNTVTFTSGVHVGGEVKFTTAIQTTTGAVDASIVAYDPPFTNSVATNVEAKLAQYVSVKDFGAVGDGVTDDLAAFEDAANSDTITQVLIPAGSYYLSAVLTTTGSVTWVVDRNVTFTGTDILRYIQPNRIVSFGGYRSIESDPAFYNGIFGYLEQSASLSGYANIGIHGSARSFGGAGTAGEADIGIAAFGYNDIAGGLQGVWGLYSTVMRASGVLGATHGMEIDVANMGAVVPIWPATPFMQGLTSGAWICSGGESTEPSAGGSPVAASVGIAIIQNDSQVVKTASFEKGIVFHNNAILGTDGATGIGIAIAFATGHSMQWYNNSNQLCAEIVATGRTLANTGFRMDFTDTGIRFEDRITGAFSLAITKPAVPANGLSISGSEAGSPIIVSAQGSDTNIDLVIAAKGTGVLDFRNIAFAGSAGSSAGYLPVKVNGVSYKIQLFNV